MTALACVSRIKGLSWEDKVAYLAYRGKQANLEDLPVWHRFEDIWYVRRIFIPAGTCLVGRKHMEGHICKLLQGKAVLFYEVGQKYFSPPAILQTRPGDQIVVLAQTDVVAETWHLNLDNLRDTKVLEDSISEPSEVLFARGKEIADQVDQKLLTVPSLYLKEQL